MGRGKFYMIKKKHLKIKVKRPKQRIPVAPPGRRHKTKKDYKRVKKVDTSVED